MGVAVRSPGVVQSGSFDVWWDAQGQRILRYIIKESQVLTVGGKLQNRISSQACSRLDPAFGVWSGIVTNTTMVQTVNTLSKGWDAAAVDPATFSDHCKP